MMQAILVTLGLVALVIMLAFLVLITLAGAITWRYEAHYQMQAAKRLWRRKRDA